MATYERHGTRSIILSRDVVTGKIVAPHTGPTRTEEDFLAHMQAVVACDPKATRWHVVCDNLNIHQSESLVRWVAQISGIEKGLGKKGEYGILALMSRRAAFLSDPTHKVVFHCVQDLETKVLAFIDYYNRTMAKPFKWTYQGKALTM